MPADQLVDHVPTYLPQADQIKLIAQLRDFENQNYYTSKYPSDLLQGDGWTGFDVFNFSDGQRDRIKGIALSNSCDIDLANSRALPARIVFAPLVPVSNYVRLLQATAIAAEQIAQKIDSIKKQLVTSLFYLPRGAGLDEDHIALLDDLHNVPLGAFGARQDKAKLFTLSQMGAYLLLLKISIHFCRLGENVDRD
ncbi:hypothetical protein M2232_001835 [Bradyrhizobium japonicum]|uniref:hypothetical protein n=1 Tax=Bradyrhizobium japonicum TaxID=375 RepID=UPI0022270BC5|nr:hypothetical protein [Bradyrhizobium japonicum]MCW2218303.1 hypothetical protein [Bradyrhizobium japonicum]MCW2342917.1 hypothetical protein [Bradyrhizobium japonicum]